MSGIATRGVAVILAAHGDRAGATPNASLLRLAAELRTSGDYGCVTAGVLKGEPTIEQAVAEAKATPGGCARIIVFPLFMAEGYFVGNILPARIAATGAGGQCKILPPLGLDTRLPSLIHADALVTAGRAGWRPGDTRLLLVGHGSALGPASADATRAAATAACRLGGFASVATAFLEEPPFLDAVLGESPAATVVSGFFWGDGMHAGEDVPEAIRAMGSVAIYAGSIGASAALSILIDETIRSAIATL